MLEYRDFNWIEESEEKSPEEYNKILQNIKELGIIEPVVIEVGINGQAVIVDGNNRLAVELLMQEFMHIKYDKSCTQNIWNY